MKKPRRKQVRDETIKLLLNNGLTGWKVRFNPRLSRALGRCISSRKTIEYMPKYMEQNDWDEVLQTIRHEVAHAVAGHGHGHDATWASIARVLGVKNPSSRNMSANLSSKFTGRCPNCKRETQSNRRTQSACGKCCREFNGNRFSSKYRLVWTRNE